MRGLDTNVLIRFLVRDDEDQCRRVYRLFKEAESRREAFFVPTLVVLEACWVLDAVYEIPRAEIVDSLATLLLMPTLRFESQPTLQRVIARARETRADLADLLIAESARGRGCEVVLSFDRRAVQQGVFEAVPP
jgi:predicted nucleic-acid-binding protein